MFTWRKICILFHFVVNLFQCWSYRFALFYFDFALGSCFPHHRNFQNHWKYKANEEGCISSLYRMNMKKLYRACPFSYVATWTKNLQYGRKWLRIFQSQHWFGNYINWIKNKRACYLIFSQDSNFNMMHNKNDTNQIWHIWTKDISNFNPLSWFLIIYIKLVLCYAYICTVVKIFIVLIDFPALFIDCIFDLILI